MEMLCFDYICWAVWQFYHLFSWITFFYVPGPVVMALYMHKKTFSASQVMIFCEEYY